jgi:hypothetical protein
MHAYGIATFGWTIDGRSDPSLCASANAASVHVVLRTADENPEVAGEDFATCTDLTVRYFKRIGVYEADLTLTDARRAPVSVTRGTGVFYLDQAGEVHLVVDLVTTTIF